MSTNDTSTRKRSAAPLCAFPLYRGGRPVTAADVAEMQARGGTPLVHEQQLSPVALVNHYTQPGPCLFAARGIVVRQRHARVLGDYSVVVAAACQVYGRYSQVYGDHCTVYGDFSIVYGRHCRVYGAHCVLVAQDAVVCGAFCRRIVRTVVGHTSLSSATVHAAASLGTARTAATSYDAALEAALTTVEDNPHLDSGWARTLLAHDDNSSSSDDNLSWVDDQESASDAEEEEAQPSVKRVRFADAPPEPLLLDGDDSNSSLSEASSSAIGSPPRVQRCSKPLVEPPLLPTPPVRRICLRCECAPSPPAAFEAHVCERCTQALVSTPWSEVTESALHKAMFGLDGDDVRASIY